MKDPLTKQIEASCDNHATLIESGVAPDSSLRVAFGDEMADKANTILDNMAQQIEQKKKEWDANGEKINRIVTRIGEKRDLLLEQMADDHFMTLKIHAHHSTNVTFKNSIKIMLLKFHAEMDAIINNTKAEENAKTATL